MMNSFRARNSCKRPRTSKGFLWYTRKTPTRTYEYGLPVYRGTAVLHLKLHPRCFGELLALNGVYLALSSVGGSAKNIFLALFVSFSPADAGLFLRFRPIQKA